MSSIGALLILTAASPFIPSKNIGFEPVNLAYIPSRTPRERTGRKGGTKDETNGYYMINTDNRSQIYGSKRRNMTRK